jgi:hypothetical protein
MRTTPDYILNAWLEEIVVALDYTRNVCHGGKNTQTANLMKQLFVSFLGLVLRSGVNNG